MIAKTCACTGVRWCAACRESEFRRAHRMKGPLPSPKLEGALEFELATQSVPGCSDFAGVRILTDFLSPAQAEELLARIEESEFAPSQSGKRKQHYGVKANFTKRKLNPDAFCGLPSWAFELEADFRAAVASDADPALSAALARYQTTDAFVLRYSEARQSNLDLHVDDLFAYGELILDLSLESDSWMTLRSEEPDPVLVRVPLPARSILALYGPARVAWSHGILAPDIADRRTSITLRTLGEEPRDTDLGRRILELASRTCD